MIQTRFQIVPDGPDAIRRLAHRFTPGKSPTLVFLPGYMSDMAGSKAQAVFDWALLHGQACLLLDYSGCGESSGDFADGTLSRWRDEVLALVEVHYPKAEGGEVVFIGSSMGGWLMLLCALALPLNRRAGLIGVAAAPDFTAWGFSDDQQAVLLAGETVLEENAYGPQPTSTFPGFWADGQANLLLDNEIAIACPVRLLHGQDDPDVPWEVSLRLASRLHSSDVQVTLIKDGDHRLSRPGDIALLLHAVAELAGAE
jgi:pimeloyl-ACP methyl ester carboxylesterase